MALDLERQLHESAATGWKRGLYDDITSTFRAPIVNWIFRTTMANYPEFLRYAWGQVKPLFTTAAFGRYSVEYRDAMLTPLDDHLPVYRREHLGMRPPEFAELRGQLATFDVVAPRLMVLFETMDRSLNREKRVGTSPSPDRAATAPYPDWLDSDRGRPPTLAGFEETPDELEETMGEIREFHGLDEGLPSIYRCAIQWPEFVSRAWEDLRPVFDTDDYERALRESRARVEAYVDAAPYEPRLAPEDLRSVGFDDECISDMQGLFEQFNRGGVNSVRATLNAFAATVDAAGDRRF